MAALTTLVSAFILWQTTRSYARRKQHISGIDTQEDEDEDESITYSSSRKSAERKKKNNDLTGKKLDDSSIHSCSSSCSADENDLDPTQSESSSWAAQHLPSHIRREQMKEERRKAKIPLLAMKKQMYDNITMLDPQGQPLSKISKKKSRWYVKKGLASFIIKNVDGSTRMSTTLRKTHDGDGDGDGNEEDFQFIQLKFEPKARSADEDYGKSTKQNICVACGDTEHQMRFYIVPFAYRHLFPHRYKSHISHDVVSLCANCHLRCGQQTQIRMNELEDRYMPQRKYTTNHDLYKVRSAALALMNWRHKIPMEKIMQHTQIVKKYLIDQGDLEDTCSLSTRSNDNDSDGMEEELTINIPKELLQKAIDVECRVLNPKFVPGPELVVQDLIDDDEKLTNFIRDWRQFFLDTMHPRHLPKGWSVDYPVVSGRP